LTSGIQHADAQSLQLVGVRLWSVRCVHAPVQMQVLLGGGKIIISKRLHHVRTEMSAIRRGHSEVKIGNRPKPKYHDHYHRILCRRLILRCCPQSRPCPHFRRTIVSATRPSRVTPPRGAVIRKAIIRIWDTPLAICRGLDIRLATYHDWTEVTIRLLTTASMRPSFIRSSNDATVHYSFVLTPCAIEIFTP
jgi:hypothetical protein